MASSRAMGEPRYIAVDETTADLVRAAARASGRSDGEIVAHFARLYVAELPVPSTLADPWTPVDVYAEYDGKRIEGQYLPANRRVTVTTEPLAGTAYSSPSGAARAVVGALNPARSAAQTNGWRFWHLTETGERLEVLR